MAKRTEDNVERLIFKLGVVLMKKLNGIWLIFEFEIDDIGL